MRRVAQGASAGFVKSYDFERWWPVGGAKREPVRITRAEIEQMKKLYPGTFKGNNK
jgi:hypothetical protein